MPLAVFWLSVSRLTRPPGRRLSLFRQIVERDVEGTRQCAQSCDRTLLAAGFDLGHCDAVHARLCGQRCLCRATQVSVDAQGVFAIQQTIYVVRRDKLFFSRCQRCLGTVIAQQISLIFSRSLLGYLPQGNKSLHFCLPSGMLSHALSLRARYIRRGPADLIRDLSCPAATPVRPHAARPCAQGAPRRRCWRRHSALPLRNSC